MPEPDAFDEYQRSLDCLTLLDEPVWERIRAAFEAGRRSREATTVDVPA